MGRAVLRAVLFAKDGRRGKFMARLEVVELSEILSLRATCLEPGCGGSVSLPVAGIKDSKPRFEKDRFLEGLRACPKVPAQVDDSQPPGPAT